LFRAVETIEEVAEVFMTGLVPFSLVPSGGLGSGLGALSREFLLRFLTIAKSLFVLLRSGMKLVTVLDVFDHVLSFGFVAAAEDR